MIPPARRLGRVMELVDDGKFFTIRAGRQTGKTTSVQWLTGHYNAGTEYAALWVDVQTAREIPEPERAMPVVLQALDRAVARSLPELALPDRPEQQAWLAVPQTVVATFLRFVCSASSRPVVVFIDEADGLVGETMVTFLTQLREGYVDRASTPFPHALALVGLREVRDYLISADERRTVAWLGTASPFNVTAETTTLRPFSREEVAELLAQHTTATGQLFEPAASELTWELCQGHPWLVNALAGEVVHRDLRDRSAAVTAAHIEAAKETIISERRSHIDSLMARLREPRVARILDPMLAGGRTDPEVLDDDFSYVVGMGLVARSGGRYVVANPIYREIIPRALTHVQQSQLAQETTWYLRHDGTLDLEQLMRGWQQFWRQDGHLAAAGFGYREAGPHLMLMAFLQRIVNGGGRVEREYGLGRGALDLLIEWQGQRHAIEVKLRRDTETEADALEQVARYLDSLDLTEGWLVLFDLRSTASASWQERLFLRDMEHEAKRIHIVGC